MLIGTGIGYEKTAGALLNSLKIVVVLDVKISVFMAETISVMVKINTAA